MKHIKLFDILKENEVNEQPIAPTQPAQTKLKTSTGKTIAKRMESNAPLMDLIKGIKNQQEISDVLNKIIELLPQMTVSNRSAVINSINAKFR